MTQELHRDVSNYDLLDSLHTTWRRRSDDAWVDVLDVVDGHVRVQGRDSARVWWATVPGFLRKYEPIHRNSVILKRTDLERDWNGAREGVSSDRYVLHWRWGDGRHAGEDPEDRFCVDCEDEVYVGNGELVCVGCGRSCRHHPSVPTR